MGTAYGQCFGRKHSAKQRVVYEHNDLPMGKKRCLRCRKVKDEREFTFVSGSKSVRMDVCKVCLDLSGVIS